MQTSNSKNLRHLNEFSSTYKTVFFIAIVKNDNYIVHD